MSQLKPVAEGLWEVRSRLRTFGVVFPLRMSVFRQGEGVVLWSPVELDDETARAIDELGEVRAIVAPNRYHHLYVDSARKRWPGASVFSSGPIEGARGMERLELEGLHFVDGAEDIDEWVICHEGSLIVTDLIFNIERAESLMSWVAFKFVARTLGGPGQSRLWRKFIQDREAYSASLDRLLKEPFTRIVPAHGDVLEAGPDALRTWCDA